MGVDYQTLSVTAYGGISIIAWLMMSLGASLLAFIFVRPGRVLRRIGGTPWHAPSLSSRAARALIACGMMLALGWPQHWAAASEATNPTAVARAGAISYRPIPAGSQLNILPADNSELAIESADSVALILKQKGFKIDEAAALVVDVKAVLVRGASLDQGPAPAQGAQQGAVRGDQYTNTGKSPADDPLTRGNLFSSEHGALLSPANPDPHHHHLLHVGISVYDRKTGWYVWRGWADRDSPQVSVESSIQQMILGLLAHFGENLPSTELPLY